MDALEVKDWANQRCNLLSLVCNGTTFHAAAIVCVVGGTTQKWKGSTQVHDSMCILAMVSMCTSGGPELKQLSELEKESAKEEFGRRI